MNPVVHFEMPYENRDRMTDFYTKAFGWQPEMLGPEMGNYVIVTTSERDPVTKYPMKPGRINGGFFKKDESKPAQVPSVVIAVDDIKAHMKMIEEAGGKVLGEPVDIPGNGLYVAFFDTEGNRVSIIQPIGM